MTPTSLSTSDAETKLTVNSSIKAITSMKPILFLNLINFTSKKQKFKNFVFASKNSNKSRIKKISKKFFKINNSLNE